MKSSIKNYFEDEILQITPPPMPSCKPKNKKRPWDNILLTAMAIASMVILYHPDSSNSQFKNLKISKDTEQYLLSSFTRVAYEADLFFNEKRSQND